ncbi:tRNA (adenosine(37)-N6)-dimethylallyltransferase MiaA, partial [Balneolaceae bacterium ANBcel3]|nr:tRNA (adenosine(37)-N6)-dimethylallyltransferase MiaA [Balneolaceae bacterium ANBcel3]
MYPIILITGATATGKSDLAIQLARHYQAPVISADSRQCYRFLDIGTAKVSDSILKEIPHYFISCLNPDESTSAQDFSQRASSWISSIKSEQKPVIIVGGSTLYLEALIRPIDPVPPKNPDNIAELEQRAQEYGLEHIREMLEKADPAYARQIDGLNPHRMYRALDVWMQTGKPFSSFHTKTALTIPEHMLAFVLHQDRTVLHERIS